MGNSNELMATHNQKSKEKGAAVTPIANGKISNKNTEKFIIKYSAEYIKQTMDGQKQRNIAISTKKRVVFVSLIGLYRSWSRCPPHLLYPAMFVLPIKRKWIYNPQKYVKELSAPFAGCGPLKDIIEKSDFMELLRWKDRQNLLICALKDYSCNDSTDVCVENALIDPFWIDFSSKLVSLYDPVSRRDYKPLIFSERYWCRDGDESFDAQYSTKAASILAEYYFVTLKFKTMQEIIFQSNPHSLRPVVFYDDNDFVECKDIRHPRDQILGGFFDQKEVQNWWLSDDYDPEEIERNIDSE